jgi:hypothetical protein
MNSNNQNQCHQRQPHRIMPPELDPTEVKCITLSDHPLICRWYTALEARLTALTITNLERKTTSALLPIHCTHQVFRTYWFQPY